jgi:uncharacterized protein (TIGR02452 family)
MAKEENIQVFEDTAKHCKEDPKLVKSIEYSSSNQVLIPESENFPEADKAKYSEKADVIVTKNRTYQAAAAYKGQKVCALNFASAVHPGGGVAWGSSAQEECLCRCSTLYFCLDRKELHDGFYSIHKKNRKPVNNDDCIYTPNVTVFKSDTRHPEMLPSDEWYNVNVITCAAPDLREKFFMGNQKKISDEELSALHEKRMRRILDIAAANDNEVVILGAFGCGAFANPPAVVAKALKKAVQEYLHCFKKIEFAVYCSPRDDTNYRVFEEVLGQM